MLSSDADADNVIFVETCGPWGSQIDPLALSLRDLRLHLRARGCQNTSGSKGELVVQLRELLAKEQKDAWEKRRNQISKDHKRLRALVEEIEEDDDEFELAQANKWKKDYEMNEAWDWTLDPRSLFQREREARKRYDMKVRARQRKQLVFSGAIRESEAKRQREKKEKEQQQRKKLEENLIKIRIDTCLYKDTVDGVNYYCVNPRFKAASGATLRWCAFHAQTCSDLEAHAGEGQPRVRHPNDEALCNSCYKRSRGRIPRRLERHRCPGTHIVRPEVVSKLAQVKELALQAAADAEKEEHESASRQTCRWVGIAPHGDKLTCENKVLNRFGLMCGYHTQRCHMEHPGQSPKITEPNELGLCRSHYTIRTGNAPDVKHGQWNYIGGLLVPPGVRAIREEEYVPREHSLRPKLSRGEQSEIEAIDARAQSRRDAKFQLLPEKKQKLLRAPNHVVQFIQQVRPQELARDVMYRVIDKLEAFSQRHKTVQLAIEHYQDQRRALRRVLLGHVYATRIQRAFRGFYCRRSAAQLQRATITHRRWAAATVIQKTVRRIQARKHVEKYRMAQRRAVALLQKVARGHITRREMRRMRAARNIQRVFRGFVMRLNIVGRQVVGEFRAKRADATWAHMLLVRYLKRYIKRWRAEKAMEYQRYLHKCATKIQRAARRKIYYMRMRQVRITKIRRHRAASIIQQRYKSFLVIRKSVVKEVIDERPFIKIQAVWRGFRARIIANIEREAVEKAWRWLNTDRPRTSYDRFIPRTNYGRPVLTNGEAKFWMDRDEVRMQDLLAGIRRGPPRFWRRRGISDSDEASNDKAGDDLTKDKDLSTKRDEERTMKKEKQKTKLARKGSSNQEADDDDMEIKSNSEFDRDSDPCCSDSEGDASSAPKQDADTARDSNDDDDDAGRVEKSPHANLWSKLPFVAFDAGNTGRIRRYEFEQGLHQMMYRIPESQIKALVKRWSRNDGSVNYVDFLRYVRQETHACEKHRAWACPTCVTYGPCLKCDCKRYHAGSNSGSSRAVCSCGHYVAMHSMIPKIRAGRTPGSESEALSKTELQRMLAPPGPAEMPRNVVGTHLSPSQFKMHYSSEDLAVRAKTAIGCSRHAQTPVQVLPAVNMSKKSATRAFQRLGQKIISDITKESEQIVRELKQDGTWNSSVNPRDTYPGTARPQTSHVIPGIGDIERLESQQQQQRRRPGTTKVAGIYGGCDKVEDEKYCRPSTNEITNNKRTRGNQSPLRKQRKGDHAQALLPPLLDPQAAAFQSAQLSLEYSAQHAETCKPDALGKLLLESAARPHTSAHLVRPWTREGRTLEDRLHGGTKPAYVERVVRAEKRRREIRSTMSQEDMWTSPDNFARTFQVTDPVPLIVKDNLRMETNMAPLYVDMLLALSSEECGLLEDWPAFVAYVFQSFAFLDRHWRKLVYDIRTGTLNKELPISTKLRKRVESSLKPRPDRASMLDRSLQRLGFYKSTPGPQGGLPATLPRPSTTLGLQQVLHQAGNTSGGQSLNAVDAYSRRISVSFPLDTNDLKKVSQVSINKPKSSKDEGDIPTLSMSSPEEKALPKPTSVDLASFSDQELREKLGAIEMKDVYDLARAPRIRPNLVHKHMDRDIRKYTCIFPGCGHAFMTDRDAEAHIQQEHVGKFRLANDQPEIDHRLHAYWPRIAPWIPKENKSILRARSRAGVKPLYDAEEERKLAEQEVRSYYPFRCGRPGCPERFHTQKELTAHVQSLHLRPEQLQALVGPVEDQSSWVQLRGNLQHVPPGALPSGITLPCCSKHWVMAQPRCEECVEVLSRGVPACPLQFFNSVVLHQELSMSAHMRTVVHVWNPRRNCEHLGRVVAIFEDRFKRRYIAYRRFYLTKELTESDSPAALRIREQQQQHVLLQGPPDAQEVFLEVERTHIVELHHVRGTSIVLESTRREFASMKLNNELPQLPILSNFPPSKCDISPGVYFTVVVDSLEDPSLLDDAEGTCAPSGTFQPLVKRLRDIVIDRSGLFDHNKADF